MYLYYNLSPKEILLFIIQDRKSFLDHRPEKELRFVLWGLPPSSFLLLDSVGIKITALLFLKSLNTRVEGFVLCHKILCIRKYEAWWVGQRALPWLLTALTTWVTSTFFLTFRNSPPYSVSLPNYVEELSFSFFYVNVLNQLCCKEIL